MIKKIIIGIITLVIAFLVIYLIQNSFIKNKISKYLNSFEDDKIEKLEMVRCNINIFNPKVSFVSDHILMKEYRGLSTYFYSPKNYFFGEFERGYVGTTGIKNTTFENLLKMVKEDCGQFQEAKGAPMDTAINWRWAPYNAKEEEYKKNNIDSSEEGYLREHLHFNDSQIEKYKKLDTAGKEDMIRKFSE